jgi:RimJ/RimL family protein N-acetyltransferase
MYNPYMIGKFIYLRHPTEDDVHGKWHEWMSDPETGKYLGDQNWPNSKENQIEFYKSVLSDRSRMVLSIIDIHTDKHIGVCNLSSINWVHRYCDEALIIGEKEYRKGSIAFEANSLLLKIAFLRLNLRIVKGNCAESNQFSRQLLKVLGFEELGKIEKLVWIDGKYENAIYVVLYRDVWMKRNDFK